MPIRAYLNDHRFDAETVRRLGVAFEITCVGLKIEAHNEPAKEAIARKLIELVKDGERDPNRLSERLFALIGESDAMKPTPVLLCLPKSPPVVL
jgi:hypothetical protein